MSIAMFGGSHSTCAPMLDGRWAGEYGGLPFTAPTTLLPSWREGLLQTIWGWQQWSTTRVYPGVPSGTYVFDVRCATDSGFVQINNGTGMYSYVSVIELK